MEITATLDERLIIDALACGAKKAEMISGDSVALSATFRDICASNSCGKYGKCYMCPPDVGDIHALMDMVRKYSRGLLYQTISVLEDSFDYEGMTAAGQTHVQVSQRLQERLKPLLPDSFVHLTCGGCRLCESCAKREGKLCLYPDRALPSLESYGIDVYSTTKGTSLKYINGPNTVTYFGIVLFHVKNDA